MDQYHFQITGDRLDSSLIQELENAVSRFGGSVGVVDSENVAYRGVPEIIEPLQGIIVTLGSAGVFTVVYQILKAYLERNRTKEVTIERNGVKLRIKSHNFPEEKRVLEMVLPELNKVTPVAKRKRLKK